jgi:hypothetical protein
MTHVPVEYPFVTPTEQREYRLFPDTMENDPVILFHGTAEASLESIVQDGFEIRGGLPSVSFADKSSLPLGYACRSRKATGDKGVIIAAAFRSAEIPFASNRNGIIHVYKFEEQPQIVGFCVVPADYDFR